jgi:MspA
LEGVACIDFFELRHQKWDASGYFRGGPKPAGAGSTNSVNPSSPVERNRKNMTVFNRVPVPLVTAIVALFVGSGTSHASLDNEVSQPDHQGRTLTIQQWDTLLNDVPPLDRNRLTREWFHSGKATFIVSGESADDFKGRLELGYQIGFPGTQSVNIGFTYTTPNILLDDANVNPLSRGFNPLGSVISTNLIPHPSIDVDSSNGPGVQEVATLSVNVAGGKGTVAVSNAHGTVTGTSGDVLLRPYARLVSNDGDSVTTYGQPQSMS